MFLSVTLLLLPPSFPPSHSPLLGLTTGARVTRVACPPTRLPAGITLPDCEPHRNPLNVLFTHFSVEIETSNLQSSQSMNLLLSTQEKPREK